MRSLSLILWFALLLPSVGKADALPPKSFKILDMLVRTHSVSQDRKIIIPVLRDLGFQTRTEVVGPGHEILLGQGTGTPRVALIGHVDTVFQAHSAFKSLRLDGAHLSGPGVIDMKGGIVVFLEALSKLTDAERARALVIINDDEETGSRFSKSRIKELTQGIPYGLVFEPGLADGAVVTSSAGVRWVKISIQGKASHAGIDHIAGINACAALTRRLSEIHMLTDYAKNLTVNIGTLEGGTQANVVCEKASSTIDLRYVAPADLQQLVAEIEKISKTIRTDLKESPKLQIKLETVAEVEPFTEASSRTLFAIAHELAEQEGIHLTGKHVGYATDANYLASSGIALLVGLGPYGGGMHTEQEFMKISSWAERVKLAVVLLRKTVSLPPSGSKHALKP